MTYLVTLPGLANAIQRAAVTPKHTALLAALFLVRVQVANGMRQIHQVVPIGAKTRCRARLGGRLPCARAALQLPVC
jgi:hypothetical protein